MDDLTQAKAVERNECENLTQIIEAHIASFPASMQDKARAALKPTFERIAATDTRDDAIEVDVFH